MALEHSENDLLERKNDNRLHYLFYGAHRLHKISEAFAGLLVPKLRLGNPVLEAPASCSELQARACKITFPSLELGNEPKSLPSIEQIERELSGNDTSTEDDSQ